MHMLRARMGDASFLKMLGSLVQRYRYKAITTDEFRRLAAEFMPAKADDRNLEAFFDQWVYGTGIPTLRISHKREGKAPRQRVRVTLTQSGVPDDFTALVPVEIGSGKTSTVRWIQSSSEPVTFTVDIARGPVKVQLDPGRNVLAMKP
jgi:aminopeptidase N